MELTYVAPTEKGDGWAQLDLMAYAFVVSRVFFSLISYHSFWFWAVYTSFPKYVCDKRHGYFMLRVIVHVFGTL
jgi:hypothetical protein